MVLEKDDICTAPIKFANHSTDDYVKFANHSTDDYVKFANHSTDDYVKTGNATLRSKIINQCAYFAFALFTGGLINMTVTWTSDSNIEWGRKGQNKKLSPAGAFTFTRSSMCVYLIIAILLCGTCHFKLWLQCLTRHQLYKDDGCTTTQNEEGAEPRSRAHPSTPPEVVPSDIKMDQQDSKTKDLPPG